MSLRWAHSTCCVMETGGDAVEVKIPLVKVCFAMETTMVTSCQPIDK